MGSDNVSITRAIYEAYVRKDRDRIEALLAKDFHFTGPLDNRLDRKTYFERCWPNSAKTTASGCTRGNMAPLLGRGGCQQANLSRNPVVATLDA